MKTLLLCALVSLNAFAISEQNYNSEYQRVVRPYFETFKSGSFQNKQGLKVFFKYRLNAETTSSVVVLPGRSEPLFKFAEVLFDLSSEKANFFIIDHQGQGQSQRTLKDSQKGYVRHFDSYVDDVEQFMDEVVVPKSKNKALFLLSHSMGGAIATRYMARHPQQFERSVLSAPMLKINTDPYPEFAARLLASTLALAGKGANYAPGKGPYKADEDTFQKNTATHSRVRFDLNKAELLAHPEQIIAGPSVRWVEQSLKATKKSDQLARNIQTPVLLFQAELDTYVMNDRQTSFCTLSPSCKMVRFTGSYHEILQERDAIRGKAIDKIRSYFKL
jgi:lysophospholipase